MSTDVEFCLKDVVLVNDLVIADTQESVRGGVKNGPGSSKGLAWQKCTMGCDVNEKDGAQVYLLSCFHVVCSDACLKKFREGEGNSKSTLACKLCKETVKEEDLKNKMSIKDTFKRMPSLEDVQLICDNCINNRPATVFCSDCPMLLCDFCAKFHRESKRTTQHTISKDVAGRKDAEFKKLIQAQTTCDTTADHAKNPLTYFCFSCNKKLCNVCEAEHSGHNGQNLQVLKKQLAAKTEISKRFIEDCNRAFSEISKKREEFLKDEWKNTQDKMTQYFHKVLDALKKRLINFQKETIKEFTGQMAFLNSNKKSVETFKEMTERFLTLAREMEQNRDVTSQVQFFKHSQKISDTISNLSKQLTKDFDGFVKKNYHFDIDTAEFLEAEKFISNCGKIVYKKFESDANGRASALNPHPSTARDVTPATKPPASANVARSTQAPSSSANANVVKGPPLVTPTKTGVATTTTTSKTSSSANVNGAKLNTASPKNVTVVNLTIPSQPKAAGNATPTASSSGNAKDAPPAKPGPSKVCDSARKSSRSEKKSNEEVQVQRNEKASASYSKASSDLRRGIRNRKKKGFPPEFVDTEATLKYIRRRAPPEYIFIMSNAKRTKTQDHRSESPPPRISLRKRPTSPIFMDSESDDEPEEVVDAALEANVRRGSPKLGLNTGDNQAPSPILRQELTRKGPNSESPTPGPWTSPRRKNRVESTE